MNPPLTAEERTRLYAVFNPCPSCSAHRGVYCHGPDGRIWKNHYHWNRGPFARHHHVPRDIKARQKYRTTYENLRAQVIAQRKTAPNGSLTASK